MRRDAIEAHRREKSNPSRGVSRTRSARAVRLIAWETLRQIQPNEQERAECEAKPERKGEAPENGARERGEGDAVTDQLERAGDRRPASQERCLALYGCRARVPTRRWRGNYKCKGWRRECTPTPNETVRAGN